MSSAFGQTDFNPGAFGLSNPGTFGLSKSFLGEGGSNIPSFLDYAEALLVLAE